MSSAQDLPIGIFDSGIGGLTVFREIARLLPQEDLIYLGDTARVPYGTKSAQTVTRYALQNVRVLLERGVKMIVVACNTASAFALPTLECEFPIPILGVIRPGVEGALHFSRTRRIGVIGTQGTIESGTYAKLLREANPQVQVFSTPCPLFVPFVEEGRWEGEIVEAVAKEYLQKMVEGQIDTLILGCTHYPLLKKALRKVMGPEVSLIDSAEETAREVSKILTEKKQMHHQNKNPAREFWVTDSPERFRKLGELFLGSPLKNVRHVEI